MNIHGTATPEIRPISTKEFPEFYRSLIETFGADVNDQEREADQWVFEPDRSLAVVDGGRIVGTSGAYSRRMTVPGGPTPVAAVTMVSVAPTHRRRGHLTAMMRRQLTDLFESQREPLAVLWASEGGIYGRFGYGMSSRTATLTGRTTALRIDPRLTGSGRIRQVSMEELRRLQEDIYESVRSDTVGWLDRPGRWWDYRFRDFEFHRRDATAYRAVVHDDADGTPTGYAVYRIKRGWTPTEPDGEVIVREIVALHPAAYAATWAHLLSFDLVRRVSAEYRPIDEPLQHLVSNPYAVLLTLSDNMWVRTVDVGRALAARSYSREIDVVLEVADEFCPWNVGRWRLSGGPKGAQCERTVDAADIALSSTELGAAFLGGHSLSLLAAAGRVRDLRRGAVAEVSPAFTVDRQPWCPEMF